MKNIILLALILLTANLQAQLEAISLHNRYNADSSTYTVVLIIDEGEAISVAQRTQFNCQVSIVTPPEGSVEIVESHNPLQNNFEVGTGTMPATWSISSSVLTPDITPDVNYFSVVVQLSPTARYNQLAPGDCVELFTYRVNDCSGDCARFYRNGEDPIATDTGMSNSDFSNGFTVGSPVQLFSGISDGGACLLSHTYEEVVDVSVYPNPAIDYLLLPLIDVPTDVQIRAIDGQLMLTKHTSALTTERIDISSLPAGPYVLTVSTGEALSRQIFTKL